MAPSAPMTSIAARRPLHPPWRLRAAAASLAALGICALLGGALLLFDGGTSTSLLSDRARAPAYLADGSVGSMSPEEEAEAEGMMHRFLASLGGGPAGDGEDDLSIPDRLLHAGEEGHPSADEALAGYEENLPPRPDAPLPRPYSMVDAVRTARLFENSYAVLVYDNEDDRFLFHYTSNQQWTSRCVKLVLSFKRFTGLLRRTFPERFCGPECPEFAVGIASGDYPRLHGDCIMNFPHASPSCVGNDVPVLQFGSVFRSPEIFPGMIAMPVPISNSLHCFKDWAERKEKRGKRGKPHVCHDLVPKGVGRGRLVFGDQDLTWEDLRPQLIWRGTDFDYLGGFSRIDAYGRMTWYAGGLAWRIGAIGDPAERRRAAMTAMRDDYAKLLPRWQGVVLSAEARSEAEEENETGEGDAAPWADIKFVPLGRRGHIYEGLAKIGISAVGERMSSEELARYRYHIDIGGGGGTTWTGTVQKLALPGLLFHHVTPMKDYIHDRMTPWVHHVPVRSDLSDLRDKYDWAEAHPEAAGAIAARGTELMRRIGTVEGFEQMFREDFVEPVRRVIEAYQPVATTHPGMSWREVLDGSEDDLPRMVFMNK